MEEDIDELNLLVGRTVVAAYVIDGDKWATKAIRLSFSDGMELTIRSCEGVTTSWLDICVIEEKSSE